MTITPEPPDLTAQRPLLASASPTRAWKDVRTLVLDGRNEALALAVEFAEMAEMAEPSMDMLLALWFQAPSPDGFAERILAPAFVAEGRTSLQLRKRASVTGLRHLTMLRSLHLDHCKYLTDISELAALEHLSVAFTNLRTLGEPENLPALGTLRLYGCPSLTDLGTVMDLPSLKEVIVDDCPALPPTLISELRARNLLTG
ncbi:leucine-rich repeat domain-containing protein [Nonomuraea sp. NPDC049152]|uniref:leucine-rich repeat domain-containing protein n=1 Tax=Nonomuraea sp. NPDC049152 TaxID=3154350 RepID=UPI0033F7B9F4